MMEHSESLFYCEGWEAASQGWEKDNNPYPEGTYQYQMWNKGYDDYCKSDGEEVL